MADTKRAASHKGDADHQTTMALLRTGKYDLEKPLAMELCTVLDFENKYTPGAWKSYTSRSFNALRNE
jgi:hypothetical protein